MTGMDTGMNLVSGGVSLVQGAMRVVWPGAGVVGQVVVRQKKYGRIAGLLYHFHRLVSKFDLWCEVLEHVQGG